MPQNPRYQGESGTAGTRYVANKENTRGRFSCVHTGEPSPCVLADNVFEPLMQKDIPVSQALVSIVGSGDGSGIAVMFLITGIVGTISCLLCLGSPAFKELE